MDQTVSRAHKEDVDFWAAQFIERWYRGEGHMSNDFCRFAVAHRVPVDVRREVCERAEELLLGLSSAA